MALWLPPRVTRELLEERREFVGAVDQQTDPSLDGEMLVRLQRELRDIDPRLRLVKARMGATEHALRPGFWHIIRDNEGAPPTIIVWDGPGGEYREPSADMFERLARSDLWDERNMQFLRGARRRAEAVAERERERARERRMETWDGQLKAATRTQVSMNRDVPWTQNWSSNARRSAAERKKKAA